MNYRKYIKNLFLKYKKIYKLKTKLFFKNKTKYPCYFVLPNNYIVFGINHIKQLQKRFINNEVICYDGIILKDTLQALYYQLLHELGHSIDYKNNKKRVLKDTNNYNKNSPLLCFHRLEIIADNFANKEIKKLKEKSA
jgi:hypothetical protein